MALYDPATTKRFLATYTRPHASGMSPGNGSLASSVDLVLEEHSSMPVRMIVMRLLDLAGICALLVPAACAAPVAATASSSTVPISNRDAGDGGAGPAAVAQLDDGVYHPPYSMMFHAGHTWTMPVVQLAMNESRPLGPDAEVICKVDHVDSFCDRRITNITCDGEGGKLLAGAYSATLDGLWKADGADSQLDTNAMMISRFAPFAHTGAKKNLQGEVVATIATQPWGAAWCVHEVDADTDSSPAPSTTPNHKMICLQPGRGLIGGRDGNVAIGDVPRVD